MSGGKRQFRRAAFLGGTSGLARAVMRQIPELEELWLLGRSADRLGDVAREFPDREVHVIVAMAGGARAAREAASQIPLDLDLLFIAQGMLFGSDERDLGRLEEMATVNFLFPSLFLEAYLGRRFPEGKGCPGAAPLAAALVGSVAGDRARASNYWYGVGKAALAAHAEGLGAWAFQRGLPLQLTLVKPGLLATAMIAGRRDRRLVSSPETAARCIVNGLRRGEAVVYAPRWWGAVMWIVRCLPGAVFRRLRY